MSINMTSGEKNKGLSRDPWSSFTSKTDKNGTKSDQFPADIEEQMQLEFAIWRSGNSTREQVNMHLDERKGLATIVFPEGLSFFVYPLSVCKNVPSSNSNIQQRIHLSEMSYKVQILFLHNHGSVELSPNGSEAECVIPGLELDLLNNQSVQVCSQPSAEHPMCSMKLIQRPASQKKIQGTLGKKLCVPLLECIKELKTTKNLTQVLEALVLFCSNYGACLQVLSNELDDQHEHNVTDDEAIRDIQMSNLDRELQARVQEQVESTARACQVSAEVVMEISKLGASILTGDEASPRTSYSNASAATQVMWEALVKNKYLRHSKDLSSPSQGDQNPNAGYEMGGDTDGSERSWQEIAALCRSGNQKAVLEGNVLQWCSVKYLKESCAIQITIDVGAFMEDGLDLWMTGISVYSPLIVKISLKQDWGLTPFTGGYQVDAYQGAHETHDAKPSMAVTCFIPHIVKQYVTNAHKNGTGPKQLSDEGFIIGIMRRIVYSLMFMKYNCVICEEIHFDFRHGSSSVPRPCAKRLCTVLFAMWRNITPPKIVTLAGLQTWLHKKFKVTDMTLLDNMLTTLSLDFSDTRYMDLSNMKFKEKISRLAFIISRKGNSPWVYFLATKEMKEITQEAKQK